MDIVIGLGGVSALAGFFKVRAEQRKIRAEASKIGAEASSMVASTAVSMLAPYTEQVRVLREMLASANDQIMELGAHLREANRQVLALELQVDTLTQEISELRSG